MAVQETVSRPAPFVEKLGVNLGEQVLAQQGVPVVTQGLGALQQQQAAAGLPTTKQDFETKEQFEARQKLADAQQRAALAFEQRQIGLEGLKPEVAPQDALQARAQKLAEEAGLRQQAFQQAAAQRQQDIANRGALASQLQGLGGFQAGLGQTQAGATGTDIARLGQLGALNQAQEQAEADARREAARQATFLPQEQLDRFAAQVTGIMGGYPAQTQTTNIPNPTPLQTALGVGTTLAGIYGGFKNPGDTDFGGFVSGGRKALGI
jgi:hypothetical protein